MANDETTNHSLVWYQEFPSLVCDCLWHDLKFFPDKHVHCSGVAPFSDKSTCLLYFFVFGTRPECILTDVHLTCFWTLTRQSPTIVRFMSPEST